MKPLSSLAINIRQNDHIQGRGRTVPRPVNLLLGDDFKCALLGSLGFSTRLIMKHTGLTPSQVGYRLRKGEIRRSDYRNGESSVAEDLMQRARVIAVPALKEHLRKVISSNPSHPPASSRGGANILRLRKFQPVSTRRQ